MPGNSYPHREDGGMGSRGFGSCSRLLRGFIECVESASILSFNHITRIHFCCMGQPTDSESTDESYHGALKTVGRQPRKGTPGWLNPCKPQKYTKTVNSSEFVTKSEHVVAFSGL